MANHLREAPELPEMPQVEAVRPTQFQGRGNVPMTGQSGGSAAPVSMGRQLRRLMGTLAAGGIALAAFLVFWQTVAAEGKGPFELLAQAEAKFETAFFNAKMGVAPGAVKMTEAEYREAIAEAERRGAAKAEYDLQEKIAALQANQQRIVGAYQALYQRANMIAQAGLSMEAQLQDAKTRAVMGASGGNQIVATYGDIGCALGIGGCEAAAAAKQRILTDIENARTGQVGQRINQLLAEVPDPAQLVTGADLAANGAPALKNPGTAP